MTPVLFQVFPLSIQEETEYLKYSNSSFLPFFCFHVFLQIAYSPSSPGSVLSFLLKTDFNQTLDLKVPKQPTKNVFQYVKFEKSQQGLWYNTVISLTTDYYFIVNENSIWHGAGNNLPKKHLRSTAMKNKNQMSLLLRKWFSSLKVPAM